jgi:hypothetical protein
MTISKGGTWGHAGRLEPGAPTARDDAELAHLVAEGRTDVPIGLLGGDLHRTLGSPPADRLHDGGMVYPIDVLEVRLDDRDPVVAVAHVVARRGALWRHETAVAMNAAFVGPLDLGPRAHPDDGLVDVTVGRLAWRERRLARSRMLSGSHLPHPALRTSRVRRWEIELERPTPVALDGVDAGVARHLVVEVLPDRARVIC